MKSTQELKEIFKKCFTIIDGTLYIAFYYDQFEHEYNNDLEAGLISIHGYEDIDLEHDSITLEKLEKLKVNVYDDEDIVENEAAYAIELGLGGFHPLEIAKFNNQEDANNYLKIIQKAVSALRVNDIVKESLTLKGILNEIIQRA